MCISCMLKCIIRDVSCDRLDLRYSFTKLQSLAKCLDNHCRDVASDMVCSPARLRNAMEYISEAISTVMESRIAG